MSASWPGSVRIDVCALLRDTRVPLRLNLVTRPTGRRVRDAIERCLAGNGRAPFVSLIDFMQVPVLDFSCADEVVARLLVKYLKPDRPCDAFFLFRVGGEIHRHTVEAVLGRHGLAAVCDMGGGGCRLIGTASKDEGMAWHALEERQRIGPGGLASMLGVRGDAVLTRLAERRLVYQAPTGTALALSAVASCGESRPSHCVNANTGHNAGHLGRRA